jgi:hypothetical protein|tara:strand:+ start:43 stop:864 length:822 start_codon:yes stop_codon:yes gene_type:complete
MASKEIKPQSVSELTSKMLRPSLSSYFLVEIPFPTGSVRDKLSKILDTPNDQEKLNLHCAEASLPGSSLATYEINNDRTGVTERHAYRRIFDDRIDLTFYVDAEEYLPIKFFETWMRSIVGEDPDLNPFDTPGLPPRPDQTPVNLKSKAYNYRVKYPDDYMADQGLKVFKFERDYTNVLEYEFIRSFPVSMNSIPVSYDGNDLLRCTVSMSYIRYVMNGPYANPFTYKPADEKYFENNRNSLLNDRSGFDFEFDPNRFGLNRRILQDSNQGFA